MCGVLMIYNELIFILTILYWWFSVNIGSANIYTIIDLSKV